MGGAIRAREAKRLFHAAASKLCDWSDALPACEKVRRFSPSCRAIECAIARVVDSSASHCCPCCSGYEGLFLLH